MKVFLACVLLAAVVAVQAKSVEVSPFLTLKDYYASHKEDSRIISGSPAARHQFPWQAAVFMRLSGGGGAFCGGSLISPSWILTAAHCAKDVQSWTILLGTTYSQVGHDSEEFSENTSDGLVHPGYNIYLNNDIALIKLPEPVPLSDAIQPIRLPSRSQSNDRLENRKVTVSGWGKTSDSSSSISSTLNYVQLDTITNNECAKVYGNQVIIHSTLCAIGHPEQSTCNGDSGGPLVIYDDDGEATQVGVVSFVHASGCASGKPSGYVRTGSFLDWISQNTGIPIRK